MATLTRFLRGPRPTGVGPAMRAADASRFAFQAGRSESGWAGSASCAGQEPARMFTRCACDAGPSSSPCARVRWLSPDAGAHSRPLLVPKKQRARLAHQRALPPPSRSRAHFRPINGRGRYDSHPVLRQRRWGGAQSQPPVGSGGNCRTRPARRARSSRGRRRARSAPPATPARFATSRSRSS